MFRQDMLLDIPLIADFELLRQRRQVVIDQNLRRANRACINHDYQPNQEVLKLIPNPKKLDPRAEGPYHIVQVYTNGTVTLQLTPLVQEQIGIRCIKPYCC